MRCFSVLLCCFLATFATSVCSNLSRSEVKKNWEAVNQIDTGRRAFSPGDETNTDEHFEIVDHDALAAAAFWMAIRTRQATKPFDRAAALAVAAIARSPDDKSTAAFSEQTFEKECVCRHKPANLGAACIKSESVNLKPAGQSELNFNTPSIDVDLSPAVFNGAVGVSAVLADVSVWGTLDVRVNADKDHVRKDCVDKVEVCPTYQHTLSRLTPTNAVLVSRKIVTVGTAVLGAIFAGRLRPNDRQVNEKDLAVGFNAWHWQEYVYWGSGSLLALA